MDTKNFDPKNVVYTSGTSGRKLMRRFFNSRQESETERGTDVICSNVVVGFGQIRADSRDLDVETVIRVEHIENRVLLYIGIKTHDHRCVYTFLYTERKFLYICNPQLTKRCESRGEERIGIETVRLTGISHGCHTIGYWAVWGRSVRVLRSVSLTPGEKEISRALSL